MATALEDRCPICLDTWINAACTVPCLHRFCFSCIRQWAEIKPECPLCKTRMTSIRHSLWGDKFEEIPIRPRAASLVSAQDEGPYELPSPRALRVDQPWNLEGFVAGPHPSTRGFLFRNHPDFLEHLQPWLHQELRYIFGDQHIQAWTLENMIQSALPILGLHGEHLVEELQADLQNPPTVFVQEFIEFAVELLRGAAHSLLLFWDSHAAASRVEENPEDTISSAVFTRWPEHSPMASTSSVGFPEQWEGSSMASTSSTGFQGWWESSSMASTSSVGFAERWEGSSMASTSSTGFQGWWEGSSMASTSTAASRGGTPAPGPAPSSSAAEDQLPSTSTSPFRRRASRPPSILTPIPEEQEELPKEPGQAACGGCLCSQPGQELLTSGALVPSAEEDCHLRGCCRMHQETTLPVRLGEDLTAGEREARAAVGPHANPPGDQKALLGTGEPNSA